MPDQFNRYERSILSKMWIKGCIGQNYEPVEHLMSDIPRDQWDKAKQAIESLKKQMIIGTKKGGNVAAIMSNKVEKVREIIKDDVPPSVLDLH